MAKRTTTTTAIAPRKNTRAVTVTESPREVVKLHEEIQQLSNNNELLIERLADLELALEDRDYLRMTMDSDREFSREGLRRISRIARMSYLKNPLIQRTVNVKRLYVWGQGINIKAQDGDINDVLQKFMDDPKNQQELTSHEARMMKEVDLEIDGNIFFVFFPNVSTGRVRMRSIPFDEIADILTDPNDRKSPWFYKRQWMDAYFDMSTGVPLPASHTEYYPDWQYDPVDKPPTMGGFKINWDTPVYHIKLGGFSDWRFGVSEVYAALDWARAYKSFLENWSSLVAAYARFAWQLKTSGGAAGIAQAKTKLATTISAGTQNTFPETNPPSVTAGTFIKSGDQVDMQPVRTAGATTTASDGRQLLLMVAAVAGLPETFYGDATAGSLATARSLDRPTELMMEDRRTWWKSSHDRIFDYVVMWAIKASGGALAGKGQVIENVVDGQYEKSIEWGKGKDGEDINDHIDIEFNPLVQTDMMQRVTAIVNAATLTGLPLADTLDLQTVTRMLLIALGQDDVDELMDHMFPVDSDGNPVPPNPLAKPPEPEPAPETTPPVVPAAESMILEAAKEFRKVLVKIREEAKA